MICIISCIRRNVNFDLQIADRLDSLDEGIEVAYQINNGREWIPLVFYSPKDDREDQISVGDRTNGFINIRGYNVSSFVFTGERSIQLKLCGGEIMQNNASLSFRWLQTVISIGEGNVDPIYLDNVQISINSSQRHVLFKDNFDSQIIK